MDKAEIAGILNNIGVLLELQGGNPFRVRAYQNGARVLLAATDDVQTLVDQNRLTDIKGIGKGLAEDISTLVRTGKLPFYDELRKKVPDGLLELTRIQGLGPKRAKIICEKLKIKDLAGLEKACREGKVAKLKGFGETAQENILKGISFAANHAAEHLIDDAEEAADEVIAALKKLPAVKRISACGSLRRRKETVHDVDILAAVDELESPSPGQRTGEGGDEGEGRALTRPPKSLGGRPLPPKAGEVTEVAKVMEAFVTLPQVTRVLAHGDTKSSVIFGLDGMQVDLRIVSEDEFPFAQHYFTGSKEHNIVMRQRAIQRGLRLNEYGLFKVPKALAALPAGRQGAEQEEKGLTLVKCKDEEELFKALGLRYIPPELREDCGEIQAAEKNTLPALVEANDIRGVFHVHSTWSDGAVELEEMVAEAERMGFEYVGISDHSQVAAYAHGLSLERLKDQRKAIDALRKKVKITIFWGTECDILKDGSLDYPESALQNFDFVIASVHSSFTLPEREMTQRIIRALKNKYTTILGHLTGRLLLRRSSYALSMDEVLKAAANEGVAVEINALPDRLELDWRCIPKARQFGCRFSCNPDAHSKRDLRGFFRAVDVARKGWCTKKDIVNTLPLAEMEAFLRARR